MRKLVFAMVVLMCTLAQAQNWTTVAATNITDLNQQKLAAGQLCFLATDQNDNPVSVGVGGGGQILKRGYCSAVASGAVTSFTVPNPAGTLPAGIYYRVTVKDSSTGQEVLRYTQVSFTGASFNFDTYAPINLGTPAPLSGNAVTGNLSVSGNVSATGTVTASNIPTNILQQIFDSGTGLTQRTSFNCMAGIKCADNAGTARTDVRLGTLTTVTFSATPIFDASTASTFKLTLTGNVTSSTLTNAVAGEPLAFEICQDATGGRTFVPPANVQGWVTTPIGANSCALETFIYDGANAMADGDTAGQVLAQDGSAATPSISFENNANTGFYRIAANRVGLALNGANSVDFQNVISIFNSGTVKTNTYVLDINNADAGISRMAAAKIGFGNGTNGNTSATMEGRAVQLDGSTSGSVTIAAPAVAGANTWTIPAATDTAVGKATIDTLTNKTLNGTASGNAITLLNVQGAVAPITGNGTDQTLYTFTIPANTIQAGKGFRIKWYGSNNGGATTLALKLKIGSTTLVTFTIAASANYMATSEIFNNASVQNAQTWATHAQWGIAALTETFGTSVENFANALAVTISGNIANPNTFQAGLFIVELIQ
ncbi:MAG TPA: hypothetical protein VF938_08710 [Candidatus Angelobacter sp.]